MNKDFFAKHNHSSQNFKCVCPKKVIIEAGYLDSYQQAWFKKLFYYGLGEFMYINKINVSMDEFFNFEVKTEKEDDIEVQYQGKGDLVPIGGGKDSVVTLELLKGMDNICFAINPKGGLENKVDYVVKDLSEIISYI